jgi:hypothetical protein
MIVLKSLCSEIARCQLFHAVTRRALALHLVARPSPCIPARRPQLQQIMEIQTRHPLPARLHNLAAMAGLLERLEREPSSASAEQYRDVARQVSALLVDVQVDEHLHLLLNAAPATAELYENMRYAMAGLCRAPLDAALQAELAATHAITQARGLDTKPPASKTR